MTAPSRGVGRLLDAMATPAPPRRDDAAADPPAGNGYVDPPALPATAAPGTQPPERPAVRSSTPRARRPAAPQASPPVRLDHMTRHQLDVATRRVVAARKRVDERLADLGTAVQAAADRRVDLAEIATVIAGAGLLPAEWPEDLAAQLGDG